MTKRIATGPFVLTLPTGEKKQFCAGEEIGAEHADHWWVQAHSTEVDAKAEAKRRAAQEADAEKLQRLTDENAQLRAQLNARPAELVAARAEADKLKAEIAALRASTASTPPPAAAADPKKKEGTSKKDDKEPSEK